MPAPRLFDDLEVLSAIMKNKEPAKVPDRQEWTIEVVHSFGDTSGRGLGSATQTGKDEKINSHIGVWYVHEEEE